jgi:hypothetical protein
VYIGNALVLTEKGLGYVHICPFLVNSSGHPVGNPRSPVRVVDAMKKSQSHGTRLNSLSRNSFSLLYVNRLKFEHFFTSDYEFHRPDPDGRVLAPLLNFGNLLGTCDEIVKNSKRTY